MGEVKRSLQTKSDLSEPMIVDTPGGRVFVKWDLEASATPGVQLTFFTEFLQTTGLWDGWVSSCPIRYTSPNAPLLVDVLGSCCWRYCRATSAIRTSRHCEATR